MIRLHRSSLVPRCKSSLVSPCTTTEAIKIRQMKHSDIDKVALLTGESFGYGNFPGIEDEEIVEAISELERWYAASVTRQAQEKLSEFMHKKREASALARERNFRRQVMIMKARLAQHLPPPPSLSELKQIERWRRARLFVSILAESQGEVVGCVNLSLFQAQAALPAPFPSLAPWVLYISSLSVSPTQRRKGVARSLVERCERIARLWGHRSIYLHVSGINNAAIELYSKSGFEVVDAGGSFLPVPLRRMLMKKDLSPLVRSDHASQGELQEKPTIIEGGDVRDGVFIWK